MTRNRSVRTRLLLRLMLPMLLLAVLAGASAYWLTSHFSGKVLDQWLHDSALALADRVTWVDDAPVVDLSESARAMLEVDVLDRTYYEVATATGRRLVGNATLPAPPAGEPWQGDAMRYEGEIRGAPVRVVAIALDSAGRERVVIKVAETQLKRRALAGELLRIAVILSLALTLAAAVAVWYGIGSGVATMEQAVQEVRARHAAAPLAPIAPKAEWPSEVVPLVEEINSLIADLAVAHGLNQRFVADAAHQLRTPVATLQVQLERALRQTAPERLAGVVGEAVGALTRLSRTLHQLLTLARADGQPAIPAQEASVDLQALAREGAERRLDDALAAGIDLGYGGGYDAIRVRGDDALLREALANLIDNALRYGRRGGCVTVGVHADPPELYVEDDGPGIPPNDRARARQRFVRLPGTPGNGCGLGLAIVEEIARRHGATLLLDSRADGQGLRARIVFPADARAARRPLPARETARA
jgi:two-component system sensor histidine kinase TctE